MVDTWFVCSHLVCVQFVCQAEQGLAAAIHEAGSLSDTAPVNRAVSDTAAGLPGLLQRFSVNAFVVIAMGHSLSAEPAGHCVADLVVVDHATEC